MHKPKLATTYVDLISLSFVAMVAPIRSSAKTAKDERPSNVIRAVIYKHVVYFIKCSFKITLKCTATVLHYFRLTVVERNCHQLATYRRSIKKYILY